MNYVNKGDLAVSKDEVIDSHGVKVFVDPKAVFYIVGTEMDFVVSIAGTN
jgi:Fe-S cluster assembly iron-binding protein IscA